MIYIPILDTLQCLLQDPGVLAEVRTDTCTCSLSFLCHTVFLYTYTCVYIVYVYFIDHAGSQVTGNKCIV